MTQPAFLDVTHSLTGRRWQGPSLHMERHAQMLQQRLGLAPLLAQVLARQGVAVEAAEEWLAPSLRALLPDPRSLRDMTTAATRLLTAAETGQRVAIFADYDVDGAASAGLLMDWFGQLGVAPKLYVPDRLTEGYGPNPTAMAHLAADHDLVVLVDCGTLGHDAIAAAKGADVVVLDHHQGGETLPDCLAVVNPNRQDESGDLGMLCAAGVVFLALVETGRLRREKGQSGPDLMAMLDLVALATVADVAPLVGVNRAFVRQGLKVMAARQRPGLNALIEAARLTGPLTAMSLGFTLGPRINAGGRIGKSDLGARLLACRDPDEAASIAERLCHLNLERRELEAAQTAEAMAQAEARGFDGPLVWAAARGWHPGVIGITASKLKEAANRPALAIALDGNEGKGSGRSVPGVDLGAAIARLSAEGWLIKGGGHAMAAGLTVAEDKLEGAMARLAALLARQGADQMGAATLPLDGLVLPQAVNATTVEALDRAGPFGASSPAPCFALPDQRIRDARVIGANHLKLRLVGAPLDIIAFGAMDGPLGPALMAAKRAPIHLAGTLDINHWQGRAIPQLRLVDAAWA